MDTLYICSLYNMFIAIRLDLKAASSWQTFYCSFRKRPRTRDVTNSRLAVEALGAGRVLQSQSCTAPLHGIPVQEHLARDRTDEQARHAYKTRNTITMRVRRAYNNRRVPGGLERPRPVKYYLSRLFHSAHLVHATAARRRRRIRCRGFHICQLLQPVRLPARPINHVRRRLPSSRSR